VNWIDPWGLSGQWDDDTKRGVDLNLFPPDKPDNDDDNIRTYAEIVPRPGDTFVVGAHGSSGMIYGKSGEEINPSELAEMIKTHSEYKEGMSITLYSCNTGKSENPYAQQLADVMGPGTVVNAPNDYIWLYENGREPFIAPYKDPENEKKGPDKKHEGDMITFTSKAGKEK
jgi:hypothetical protein